jgi:hypothetical protein
MVDYFIDAKGRGIKDVDGIDDYIKKGGIIKISNVYDSNLSGTQSKSFKYGEKGDEIYKYPGKINIKINTKRLTKDLKEKMDKANKFGIEFDVSNMFTDKLYYRIGNKPLTKEEADKLVDIGLSDHITQSYHKTPTYQTTYVIAGDDALNRLYKYNSKRINENVNKDENFFKKTHYRVSVSSADEIESLYVGDDYKEAKVAYDNAEPITKTYDSGVIIDKRTDTYKHIGGENFPIEDYPFEDYWDDEDVYELVDEGEFEEIDNKSILGSEESAIDMEQEIQEHLKDKYGRNYGFYQNIVLGEGEDGDEKTMMIRVKNHSENPANRSKSYDDFYLSIAVANNNPTAKRWYSEDEIYISGDDDLVEAIIEIDSFIKDVCEENNIKTNF